MAYKNTSALEFKGKGFIDTDRQVFVSTEKKDAGKEYDIEKVFETVAGDGDEVSWSVKKTSTAESTEPISEGDSI